METQNDAVRMDRNGVVLGNGTLEKFQFTPSLIAGQEASRQPHRCRRNRSGVTRSGCGLIEARHP